MPPPYDVDVDRLRHMIEVEKLQQWRVARILGVHRDTVNRKCRKHGIQTQRTGPRSGPGHPEWKGGRNIDADGYVILWQKDHPDSRRSGYVLEHRIVMERIVGRRLRKNEVVHHRNGNKQDNRPSNLVLFSNNGDHLKHELSDDPIHRLCVGCKMRRPAILESLAGDVALPPPRSPQSKAMRERDILASCELLQIPLPPWFSRWRCSTIPPGRQRRSDRHA